MTTFILMRTSLYAIRKHTARSFLTILGIMIGIAAIIVTFSIGHGAEEKIRKQILAMGENSIYIIPGNIIERGRVRSTLAMPPQLTEKDLYAITKQIPTIAHAARSHNTIQLIEFGKHAMKEQVYGADANILKINKNSVLYGDFFNEHHLKYRANVVVLGYTVAQKLFKHAYPIGKTVSIGYQPFTVIGVLNRIEYFWGTQDPNTRSLIPFTTSKKYFSRPGETKKNIGFITLSIITEKKPGTTLRRIRRILRFMHNIEDKEPDDFTIFDQQTISKSAERASGIIKLFGLIAATISLIVGGIGVMNIMLVSVQERTKEIGIRLAIGATQRLIQLQFLFESIILSSLGGFLGVILGITAQHIITNLANLSGAIEPIPLFIAFIMTIMTGIFFGYYPARKASLLNPVDALREQYL